MDNDDTEPRRARSQPPPLPAWARRQEDVVDVLDVGPSYRLNRMDTIFAFMGRTWVLLTLGFIYVSLWAWFDTSSFQVAFQKLLAVTQQVVADVLATVILLFVIVGVPILLVVGAWKLFLFVVRRVAEEVSAGVRRTQRNGG
jgi:hypothetical protein